MASSPDSGVIPGPPRALGEGLPQALERLVAYPRHQPGEGGGAISDQDFRGRLQASIDRVNSSDIRPITGEEFLAQTEPSTE